MKKVISLSVGLFLLFSVANPLLITSANASGLTDRGQIAIEQIATCITLVHVYFF